MGSHNDAFEANLADGVLGDIALPVHISGTATGTGSETVSVLDAYGNQITIGRYYRPVAVRFRANGTDAANVHLTIGGTAVGTATAKSTTDGAVVDMTITDAQLTAWLTAKGALAAVFSAAGAVMVDIIAVPAGR